MMTAFTNILEKFKRKPTDIVGIDVASSSVKVARIKMDQQGAISLVGIGLLPSVQMPPLNAEVPVVPRPLVLPPKLRGKYASIAVTGETSVIKILSFPGAFDSAAEAKILGNMGITEAEKYRVSYKMITEGHGRSESRVLAVALPEVVAQMLPMLFPVGLPAPFSVEVSGLAVMTSFLRGPGKQHEGDAVGVVDFGENTTTFGIFNKGNIALIRRFELGINDILEKVQEGLGVDRDTARGIVADGAFDISQSVGEVMEPLIKQLIVSRDFVERRENCHIARIYATGGIVLSRDSVEEMKSSMGLEVSFWSPYDGLNIMPDAVPEDLEGQEWRFAAALGACLATLETT